MAANKEHERDPKLIDISNPENRFEKSDVDYVAINKFGIGLVILCIFSFLLLTGVFKYFINKENAAQVAHRNLHPDLPKLPPEPRLQSTPVKDLAGQGFPLTGGRLEYAGGQPVAALVYMRQKHVINLFVWPTGAPDAAPKLVAQRQGYNLAHWTGGKMECWAVSDLNGPELVEFADKLLHD